MAVEMRFGLLADYAAPGQNGKLTAVHIFNRWSPQPENIGKPIGAGVLVIYLECSLADGATHRVDIKIRNADEEHLKTELQIEEFPMVPSGPGIPLTAHLLIGLTGIPMPDYGDYAFEVIVDHASVGRIPFHVLQPIPSPRPQ